VLLHGLFADGSSWSEVIPRLQAAGLNVTSVQNPLMTLAEAVDAALRVLERQKASPPRRRSQTSPRGSTTSAATRSRWRSGS
jgi:hypothetical protein